MNKLTIAFAMHFEAGHIYSSFCLAKRLQSHGHNVIYISTNEFKNIIENQGFNVQIFAENLLSHQDQTDKAKSSYKVKFNSKSAFHKYLELIDNGTLDSCILSTRANILLCDPFLSYVAVRAITLKIPVLNLFTSLFTYENQYIPPVVTSLYPNSKLLTLLSWKLLFVKFFFVKKIKNLITGEFHNPTRMHHLSSLYRKITNKSGYPCIKNKTFFLNEIGFNLNLPNIMLCTRSFQFPGDIPSNRLYVGNFVDFERHEPDMNFAFDSNPLIYCSLGTASSSYPFSKNLYDAVRDASSKKPEWNFVLQISDANMAKKYAPTDNFHAYSWVPQLKILKHTSVAITHGGLNSIMECVGYEVPMVIVPGLRDQPGNASRAAYNNIGLVANMKTITSQILIELIEATMKSEKIKEGLIAMKKAIEHENGLENGVRFIETFANHNQSP